MSIKTSEREWAEALERYLVGENIEALNRYQRLAADDPDNAAAFLMLGNSYFYSGQLDTAARQFERALEIEPSFGQAYYRLGVCSFRAGRLQKAIEAFRGNLACPGQRNVMSYYWIGITEFFLGHDEAALDAFRSLRRESPESRFCNLFMAKLLIRTRAFQEAIDLLEELMAITPELPELYLLLGAAYKGLCRPFDALQSIRQLLRIDPEDARARQEFEMITGECPP